LQEQLSAGKGETFANTIEHVRGTSQRSHVGEEAAKRIDRSSINRDGVVLHTDDTVERDVVHLNSAQNPLLDLFGIRMFPLVEEGDKVLLQDPPAFDDEGHPEDDI